jgi:formylglycine-generating enzyme required for sulfatase activity
VAAPAARFGRKAIWVGSVVFIPLVLLVASGWYRATRKSAGKGSSAIARAAASSPLVGSWEFVSAKTADGKENQAYVKAFKDTWRIKMITPAHFICVSIDPGTGRITAAHGGPCLLGNGQFTDLPEYGTDPSWIQRSKGSHYKVRFEGETFVQSFEDGNEETWRRARAIGVTTAAPRLGREQAVTIPLVGTWEFVSAKTADGKESGAHKAYKNQQVFKTITPTHCFHTYGIPATRQIISAHGGPCLLGNGEYTYWPRYCTDPALVRDAKSMHFKVRFEGETFVQSFEDGTEETWCRAKPAESATTSIPRPVEHRWTNSLGMVFVSVPGTEVKFSIWETRVRDFGVFVKETSHDMGNGLLMGRADGWKVRPGYNWQNPGFQQGPTHPVAGVNWDDAKAFCRWLTQEEQRKGTITAQQRYRLPTDAEWSAAVGPAKFPWGDAWPPPPRVGNYGGKETIGADWPANSWGRMTNYTDNHVFASPVGSYPHNALGIFDLGGNVWEWCEDYYRAEMNPPELRAVWKSMNEDSGGKRKRAFRGASWVDPHREMLASANRLGTGDTLPEARCDTVGFRVVLGSDSTSV